MASSCLPVHGRITKGLIVADPWIAYLLNGSKTWEMRSSGTSHRGWFGLIRKGSGAVCGIARMVDVGAPLSPAEMIAAFEWHRIPEHMILSGEVAKWNTPWKLADLCCLAQPVPYKHKSGAVTWVELDDAAIEGIAGQLDDTPAIEDGTAAGLPVRSTGHHQTGGSEKVTIDVSRRGRKVFTNLEWGDGEPAPASVPPSQRKTVHLRPASSQPGPAPPARLSVEASASKRDRAGASDRRGRDQRRQPTKQPLLPASADQPISCRRHRRLEQDDGGPTRAPDRLGRP